jgi:monoamine oxidase
MDTIDNKIKILKKNGFEILGAFNLPEKCWIGNYYNPLQNRFTSFTKQFGKKAEQLINQEKKEISLYLKYKEYYGYEFFVARLKI